MKLNIGCGRNKKEGYINIDKNPVFEPDIIRDITRGLPFNDDSIDEIYTSHCLEHIDSGEDIIFVMNELYRALKPEGLLTIRVPHTKEYGAFCDPTHKSFWNEQSAQYWTGDSYGYGIKTKFKILENKIEDIEIIIKFKK